MRKFQLKISAVVMPLILALFFVQSVFAQGKVFTTEELSKYNGKNGAKAYTSYQGVVYDVTDSKLWQMGEHFGLQAGIDLTDAMKNAPHGPEVFAGFTAVGTLEGYEVSTNETTGTQQPAETVNAGNSDQTGNPDQAAIADQNEVTQTAQQSETTPWYAKRIRIAGISILGWTGILLGVFFVLTFATCFALPWAKLPLPWTGSKIGKDPLDESGTHLVWSSIHKYFVWFTVILGIIHGILGLLQMVGIFI